MVEYKTKFNPADNAEVENIASKMSKPDLETYYVKDRNNKHNTCGDIISMIFAVLIIIGFIGFIGLIGYAIGSQQSMNKLENSMQDISQEVCPYLSNGYASQEAFNSSYAETRIVCNQVNSGWRGR